jgi:hypothetical protein
MALRLTIGLRLVGCFGPGQPERVRWGLAIARMGGGRFGYKLMMSNLCSRAFARAARIPFNSKLLDRLHFNISLRLTRPALAI